MVDPRLITNPQQVVEEGNRIYAEKYKKELEGTSTGQFVAIDISTEEAYVAPFAEEALEKAKELAPNGLFHLIKIGAPAAFRVSYTSHAPRVGIFR